MGEHIVGSLSYGVRADGRIDEQALEVNFGDRTLYKFNPKTGVLQVSMEPAELERMIAQRGGIPKDGRPLVLPSVAGVPQSGSFRGVTRVESIPGLKDGNYVMRIYNEPGESSEN